MFYNTTQEDGNAHANMSVSNAKQEEIVLAIFSQHKRLAPSQALAIYHVVTGKSRTPVTSIRRAISDLTRQGRLEQTTEKHTSPLNKSEWIWQFRQMQSDAVSQDRKQTNRKTVYMADPVKKQAAINRINDLYNHIHLKTWFDVKHELMNLLDDIKKL